MNEDFSILIEESISKLQVKSTGTFIFVIDIKKLFFDSNNLSIALSIVAESMLAEGRS